MNVFVNTEKIKGVVKLSTLLYSLTLCLLLALVGPSLHAASVSEQVKNDCAGCHALMAPGGNLLTERMTRTGPALYYAGSKYNAAWMEKWLQAPTQVRPGGEFFAQHTVVTDEGDIIDQSTLTTHPVLSSATAAAMTQHLMTLQGTTKNQLDYKYKAKKSSRKMGAMNFGKFKGCKACHQDEAGYGGLSGPELHSVFSRLQPNFIASYIRDPQQWEPRSLMPNKQLNDKEIQKLMDYFNLLGGEL